jgi:hypothetical protein
LLLTQPWLSQTPCVPPCLRVRRCEGAPRQLLDEELVAFGVDGKPDFELPGADKTTPLDLNPATPPPFDEIGTS